MKTFTVLALSLHTRSGMERQMEKRSVNLTNLGYAYCVEHSSELADKVPGHSHAVDVTRPAKDYAGERCDWPGCREVFA